MRGTGRHRAYAPRFCPRAAPHRGHGATVQPGAWNVTSTVVDLTVPGVQHFLVRIVRGKTKAEHKRVSVGQGVEALLAPHPKARFSVDSQRIASGRYAQVLTCPQKGGEPVHISRAGTYDADGFAGRATITGTVSQGPMHIVLDQRAASVGS